MGKRNKIRYQSKPVVRIPIVLTGEVYLMYRDDDAIAGAKKGDLMVHPRCEALHDARLGEYDRPGVSGYFKLDVHDGKEWRPVSLQEIFPGRENHFAKSECSIDTFAVCEEMLKALAGATLIRTYREHYQLEEPQN